MFGNDDPVYINETRMARGEPEEIGAVIIGILVQRDQQTVAAIAGRGPMKRLGQLRLQRRPA